MADQGSILKQKGFEASFENDANGGLRLIFSGVMNEESDLAAVTRWLKTRSLSGRLVRIDLAGLSRINSVGVRDWILFLENLFQTPGVSARFSRLSFAFVEQFNRIPQVLAKFGSKLVFVDEIELPFHCVPCNKNDEHMFAVAKLKQGLDIVRKVPCKKCGAVAELDLLESELELFLQNVET